MPLRVRFRSPRKHSVRFWLFVQREELGQDRQPPSQYTRLQKTRNGHWKASAGGEQGMEQRDEGPGGAARR